ncbi:MAG TPA: PEP-utilizing enzyme [Pseudonocardia sp.]
MLERDPLNRVSDPATFWTTVNATEALPGTTTPLTWSFYDDATELALRGTFAEIGALAQAQARRDRLPSAVDGRFVGIFLGHPAANMTRFRLMADLTPGGSGDALERQFFGTKRSGVAPVRSKRRYPAVAARLPVAAARAPGRIRTGYHDVDSWWRALVAGPALTPARARALLPAAADRYRAVLHWHGVGTMITQGVFDQLSRLAAAHGRPGLELELVAGLDELSETDVLDDLWQVSRDRLPLAEALRRHGCHARDAGELSVRSWREDATQPLAAVAQYRGMAERQSPKRSAARSAAAAAEARARFLAGLGRAERGRARLLVALARRYLPLREVGRGGLLRALDAGRMAARVLGADLHRRDLLASPDDVFFLTMTELGAAPGPGLADEVARRRARYAEYAELELPESWFGNPAPTARPTEFSPAATGRGSLAGVAACAGSVTGPARVVHGPDEVDLEPGEVLVCHTTDPSWASLMSLAAGLVIDVGGPLSHGAIVARELGVPCVIGTRDGTRVIRTGDLVHVDGTTGVVTVKDSQERTP